MKELRQTDRTQLTKVTQWVFHRMSQFSDLLYFSFIPKKCVLFSFKEDLFSLSKTTLKSGHFSGSPPPWPYPSHHCSSLLEHSNFFISQGLCMPLFLWVENSSPSLSDAQLPLLLQVPVQWSPKQISYANWTPDSIPTRLFSIISSCLCPSRHLS